MNDHSTETEAPRGIWMRGLLMILMALAYQLASTLLFFVLARSRRGFRAGDGNLE